VVTALAGCQQHATATLLLIVLFEFPRYYPLVFLAEVRLMEGEAVGSGKSKGL
jgi:hypothetical protein